MSEIDKTPMNVRIASWQSLMPGTEVVSTDPKPVGEGDVIHVQHMLTEEKPTYCVKTI